MDAIEDIKRELKSGKLVFGKRETVALLRQGKIVRVLLASNCPQTIEQDMKTAASGVPVEKLPIPNDELGVVCKKQFTISVLGEKKL